ncbi:MAG: ABC transporter ATP-binding protein [Desulfobacteraceae bacterium]|jgi:ATP-binding cassette subfamily B protein
MLSGSNRTDIELIEEYTNQPSVMPIELRKEIERNWGNRPVELYAHLDLDTDLKLASYWLALGEKHVAIVTGSEKGRTILNIRLEDIKNLSVEQGLSCSTLILLGDSGSSPLARISYTLRQRRSVENIRFVIEQRIDGRNVDFNREPDRAYRNSVIHPIREAQASVASNKLSVVWRLMRYLKPYKKRLILGLSAAVLLTGVSLLPAYLTGYVIDKVIKPYQSEIIDYEKAMHTAWVIIAALGVIYMVRVVSLWVRLHSMSVLGELVAGDLRRTLYEHMQKLSLSFFSTKHTGTLISRVSSDSDRLWDFIAFGVVEASLSVIMLLGLGAVLLILDWRLGLVLTLPIPIFLWAFSLFGEKMHRLFLRAWRKWSNLTAILSDTIPGIKVVKAFNQEQREKDRFNSNNDNCVTEFNSIHRVWTKFWPYLILGVHILTIGVWMFALPRIFGNGTTLSVGTFVTFLLYMGMYLQPIETIGMMARMLNRATSSAHRIFEVLDTEPEIIDRKKPVVLKPLKGRVEFRNVTFAYDGIRQIIRGISFDVKPGEMIGLVGPSGAGKSTITNLIARFYDITGGEILIDGVNLKNLHTGHYRKQVGMVLQDPYLFKGTLLENIRYGMPEATVGQVIQAARVANAHDFITKLAHGYDTIIGERGNNLSGGERQRVSIARAVLCDPRILILDEATSSVDTETEQKIQEALDRLVHGRTVFAIAHRLSTLSRASRLFVIEDGLITGEGSHEELMSKECGTYYRLQTLQRQLCEIT